MLYEIWFMETKLISLENNKATVLVPMHVHKKHLKENYNDFIEENFTEITGSNFKFEYVTEEELKENVKIEKQKMVFQIYLTLNQIKSKIHL